MSKSLHINQDCLVSYNTLELGYSLDSIKIIPIFYHQDIHTDDFGSSVPALILGMLAEVRIEMQLVYYDTTTLYLAWMDSGNEESFGKFAGAGKIITGKELKIEGANSDLNWTFPKAFLTERPLEYPLGNERSIVRLTWRAVGLPEAADEVKSAGVRYVAEAE